MQLLGIKCKPKLEAEPACNEVALKQNHAHQDAIPAIGITRVVMPSSHRGPDGQFAKGIRLL
jgi:hypothetical protein